MSVIVLTWLAGCTSTTPTSRSGASPQKALEDHVQLGMNYISEGERKAARKHILRALAMDDHYAPAHNALALLFQLELEDELAEEHFRKAISYGDHYSAARNNYGVFLFKRERYKEAYKQFQAAAADTSYELRPQVYYSLGVTAEELGKSEEAEDAWLKAIALSPRYAMPYLEVADHYFRTGNYLGARNYLDRFDKLARPQARSLWLAVRLADRDGDRNMVASKGLALEKLFPNSRENREYQEWLKK